jgi:hypothetical protein
MFFNKREVVFLRDLPTAPLLKDLGPIYTHTKSHDHEKLACPKNHPMAMPWKIESQFLQVMALKLNVKWKTMLSDYNRCLGVGLHTAIDLLRTQW